MIHSPEHVRLGARISRIATPLALLCVAGCAGQKPAQIGSDPNYGTLSQGDWPALGCVSATSELYLDIARSAVVPEAMLTEPGELVGHWLAPESPSILVVKSVDPKSKEFAGHFIHGWAGDCFKITIADGSKQRFFCYLEAAYGTFVIFGADLDRDGVDEVIIERGRGRGTFAYVRKLWVCKAGPRSALSLFETPLIGYIGGVPRDNRPLPDPEVWLRRYVFSDIDGDGKQEIVLYLVPPAVLPRHMASTTWTNVLQFPKQVYGLNDELRSYELRDFTFRRLTDPRR